MPKFTRIPVNTFETLQLNAGMLLAKFDVETGTVAEEDILCASSGGFNFSDNPSFTDFGEDIDNCPKNMKELKRLDSRDIKLTGAALTMTKPFAAQMATAADVDGNEITPRGDLKTTDFKEIWWVGDYGAADGGLMAIHMMNSLSTGGFKMQSGDRAKGKFSFEFTAHVSIHAQTVVPYEIYISEGTAEATTTTTTTTITEGGT